VVTDAGYTHRFRGGVMTRLGMGFTLALLLVLASNCSEPPETTNVVVKASDAIAEPEGPSKRALGAGNKKVLAKRIQTLGVPKERSRLATNCLAGAMDACEALADDYRTGVGVRKDPRTTQLFYDFTRLLAEEYCNEGGANIDGCSQLGRMHYEGRGLRRNREWGTMLLRKGCAGGDDAACTYLENEGLAHPKE